jgi:hypothetical protein
LSGGTANFTTSALKVGTTTVNAVCDSNFDGSTSNKVKQVVKKAGAEWDKSPAHAKPSGLPLDCWCES